MEFCIGCGHRLGDGRFCTNCGHPIPPDARSDDTAERAAVPVPTTPPPSVPPPPAYTPPPKPRFPLYADQAMGPPPPTYQPSPAPASPPSRDRRPPWLPLALTLLLVLLMAVAGGLLLLSGGDGEERAEDPAPANGTAGTETSPPSEPSPTSPPPSTPPSPPPADGPQELARFATTTASKTAKPNLDTQGNQVRYEAANMLDGVAQTCWRMPGDGTGEEIVFTLSGPTELTEVGLINGYAKTSGKLDWYAGNRKVLAAEWVFDDGTVVPQSFSESRGMQSMPISPVTTSRVLLRLVAVGEPGKGPSARNYTAISDVSLVGEPA
jgi:hypothetical protein